MMEEFRKNIRDRYKLIAGKFINEKVNRKRKILCAFLTGSYYSNTLSNSSDLDIFLVTDDFSRREKGIKLIEGVKVSYFINPLSKIRMLLNSESKEFKRPTTEIVHYSTCIFGESLGKELKRRAQKTIASALPRMSSSRKKYMGWKLYDKHLVLKRNDYPITKKEYLKIDLFQYSINLFFLLHRSYKPHSKYVLEKIQNLNPHFYSLTVNYLDKKSDKNLGNMNRWLFKFMNFEKKDYFTKTSS